jgi:hypothetical protein
VLPLLYLHGLSSGDFVPALGQFLGSTAELSASVVTKLTEAWKTEQRTFSQRDLSGVDYVYLWADGSVRHEALHDRVGWETSTRQVRAIGVPEGSWFTATSVLVQYILGAAGQNAANARVLGPDVDRAEFLDAVSTAWEELDPDDYPFTRAVADQLREHDDREQFLAGIDLVLTGITAPPSAATGLRAAQQRSDRLAPTP